MGETTATLPAGWKERLVPVRSARTRGATGWCLEVHDLVIAKLFAGRDKDGRFVDAAVRHGLVQREVLLERFQVTHDEPELRAIVAKRIESLPFP